MNRRTTGFGRGELISAELRVLRDIVVAGGGSYTIWQDKARAQLGGKSMLWKCAAWSATLVGSRERRCASAPLRDFERVDYRGFVAGARSFRWNHYGVARDS